MLLKPLLEYLTPISVFGFAGGFFQGNFFFMKISQFIKRHPMPAALHENGYMKNNRTPVVLSVTSWLLRVILLSRDI